MRELKKKRTLLAIKHRKMEATICSLHWDSSFNEGTNLLETRWITGRIKDVERIMHGCPNGLKKGIVVLDTPDGEVRILLEDIRIIDTTEMKD